MLSQDNLTWTSRCRASELEKGVHEFVTYLPMNHVAGIFGIYFNISVRGTMFFTPPDAIKGSLIPIMQEVSNYLIFKSECGMKQSPKPKHGSIKKH